ncbi:Uncharacterised protein [Burkholderia pseudomallei]|nr:Uncharacterised protein [Burkholderia pseudomallei]
MALFKDGENVLRSYLGNQRGVGNSIKYRNSIAVPIVVRLLVGKLTCPLR